MHIHEINDPDLEGINLSEILGLAFQHICKKADERDTKKTNMERFQETGIMTLTEGDDGIFGWEPNARLVPEETPEDASHDTPDDIPDDMSDVNTNEEKTDTDQTN